MLSSSCLSVMFAKFVPSPWRTAEMIPIARADDG